MVFILLAGWKAEKWRVQSTYSWWERFPLPYRLPTHTLSLCLQHSILLWWVITAWSKSASVCICVPLAQLQEPWVGALRALDVAGEALAAMTLRQLFSIRKKGEDWALKDPCVRVWSQKKSWDVSGHCSLFWSSWESWLRRFLEGSGDWQCQIYRRRGSAHKAVTIGHTVLEGFIAVLQEPCWLIAPVSTCNVTEHI